MATLEHPRGSEDGDEAVGYDLRDGSKGEIEES